MPTLLYKMAEAICERRNASDWPCNGLDFDTEMARVALDVIITTIHHEAQDTDFDTGFEKFRSMLKENKDEF